MSASVLRGLNVRSATIAETGWTPDLVPKPVVDQYAASNWQLVSGYIEELSRSDERTQAVDILVAHKWRHGRRPVALLPLVDRVLYRASIDSIRALLPATNRGDEYFNAFREGPLSVSGATEVVVTDLANYYSSIQIDIASRILLQRAGHYDLVQWLGRFWQKIAGGPVGIPQVNESSDLVSEAIGEELERRVASQGITTFRYADDFRLVTSSDKRAVEALEIFYEEVRGLGLFVNERKTYTQDIDKYEAKVKNRKTANSIIEEVRDTLRSVDLYDFSVTEPSDDEVDADAARKMLSLWSEGQWTAVDAEDRNEAAKLARKAFQVLSKQKDTFGLGVCHSVLLSDPQNTPAIARYMGSLMQDYRDNVLSVANTIIQATPLSKWQRLWLLSVFEYGGCSWYPDIRTWIRAQAAPSEVEAVRTYACWVLAKNYDLNLDTWQRAVQGVSSYGSPTMSAALVGCSGWNIPDASLRQYLPGHYIDQGIFAWALTERSSFSAPF